MKSEDIAGKESFVLPVVRLGGTAYFVDLDGRQFREAMNPASYVDFDSVKGKEMCRKACVLACLRCGASVIAGKSVFREGLFCVRCKGRIDAPSHRRE